MRIRPAYSTPRNGRPSAARPATAGRMICLNTSAEAAASRFPAGEMSAHAARVGASVAVVDLLVVARGRQRNGRLPVAHRQERRLAARQEFLDEDPVSGRTEHARVEEERERAIHLLARLDDQHAFPARQPVGLQNRRIAQALDGRPGLLARSADERLSPWGCRGAAGTPSRRPSRPRSAPPGAKARRSGGRAFRTRRRCRAPGEAPARRRSGPSSTSRRDPPSRRCPRARPERSRPPRRCRGCPARRRARPRRGFAATPSTGHAPAHRCPTTRTFMSAAF